MTATRAELRAEIQRLVHQYVSLDEGAAAGRELERVRARIPYAGRVYGHQEVANLVDAALDFWLTAGPYAHRLENRLAAEVGSERALLVNSGSSANLLAFWTLTATELGDRRIERGDEVITVAAGFPTTVAPIVQYGAVPVFVDIDPDTRNIAVDQLEAALSSRTKAVMVAHTLGNPFDIDAVRAFCDRHDLWLVEDNCDALGSRYVSDRDRPGPSRLTGSFGDLATCSFYPPHHITTGEGGAVLVNHPALGAIAESFRDWGRDCWCRSGKDNTCGKRFDQQFGCLPAGYDHKYVYTRFGFNLKMTDLQAAVGLAQMDRLHGFAQARRRNFGLLSDALADLAEWVRLPVATPKSAPSWFGFLMTVRPDAPASRDRLAAELEAAGVQTRMLFAGNLVRQPCFDELRARGEGYRVVGDLTHTDDLMENGLWVGVYPGLSAGEIDRMVAAIRGAFVREAAVLVR